MKRKLNAATTTELQELFDSNNSISAILRHLKISETCPNNRKLLKERMDREIDTTKFEQNKVDTNPFYNGKDHILCDDDYFCVGDKRRSGTHIKIRLIKYKDWKDECSSCGIGPVWNNIPLSLQVDHIDGNPFNNKLDNLRILCPNCHSQTDTFGSKNAKK